jgi:hypothetical protein
MRQISSAPAGIAVLALLLGGWSTCAPTAAPVTCSTSTDCPSGQACFTGGCFAPPVGLAIDVAPAPGSRLLEQDQPLQQIDSPTLGVNLQNNASLTFSIVSGSSGAAYIGSYTITGEGQGLSVPLTRTFSVSSSDAVVSGKASIAVSPGLYGIELNAGTGADGGTSAQWVPPPLYLGNVLVDPAAIVERSFNIPASCPVTVAGDIANSEADPVLPGAVTVQAFDRSAGLPISQSYTVQPGNPSVPQQFQLCAENSTSGIDIHVTPLQAPSSPTDNLSLMPSMVFPLNSATNLSALGTLYLGGYGTGVLVSQRVVRSPSAPPPYAGQPLANAQVWFEGMVQGGGYFKSATAVTSVDGTFQVMVLPSQVVNGTSTQMSVHIIPPANGAETAAITIIRESVTVAMPAPQAALVCDEKTPVQGMVFGPDGQPVPQGVLVTAQPTTSAGVLESATTDNTGAFQLAVNPASYAFYFDPQGNSASGDLLARGYLSPRDISASASLTLQMVTIPRGLTVDVQLSAPPTLAASDVANSNVTLFQIPTDGSPPILLQQTQANEAGQFRMVVPPATAAP